MAAPAVWEEMEVLLQVPPDLAACAKQTRIRSRLVEVKAPQKNICHKTRFSSLEKGATVLPTVEGAAAEVTTVAERAVMELVEAEAPVSLMQTSPSRCRSFPLVTDRSSCTSSKPALRALYGRKTGKLN